jgi:hypothetical protein
MVRVLPVVLLTLSLPVQSFRLATESAQDLAESNPPTCECSADGEVDGVKTGKAGCAQHFGQRFGYICYVENGAECPGSRLSRRTGVYWRSCREEHLSDQAKDYMLEAMQDMDLDELQSTIEVARQRGVDPALIASAEERVGVVTRMIAARQELLEALEGFSAERLQAALETAEELELDEFLSEDTLDRAVERFRFLELRAESADDLRAAIEGHILTELQDRLLRAKVNHVDDDVVQAGEARVVELQGMIAVAATELATAVTSRDAARLLLATAEAERLVAVDSSVIQEARDRLTHLNLMDAATQTLLPAIAALNLHDLQEKLGAARQLDAYPDILSQGDARVTELTQRNLDAEAALIAATDDNNIPVLEAAIVEAESLHGGTIDIFLIQAGKIRLFDLNRRGEARAELETAVADVNLEVLVSKLARAEDLGVDATVIAQAQARIEELTQMMAASVLALQQAIAGNDEVVLQANLAEAQRLFAATAELIDGAHVRLAELALRGEAKEDLQAAISDVNRADLIAKLARAVDLGVDAPTLQQGNDRVVELAQMMAASVDALQGSILTRDSAQIRAHQREANRLFASDQALNDSADARLAHLAIAEGAQAELIPTLAGVDLALVQAKLANARTLDADPEILARAEHRIVEIQALMENATAVLAAAVAAEHDGTTKASTELQAAIDEVNRLNCIRDWPPLTQEMVDAALARHVQLLEIDDATAQLVGIYESEDMHEIIVALNRARATGVVQGAIDKGEEAASRVRELMMHARALMIELTEGNNADALQAALDEVLRLRAASSRRIEAAQARLVALRR